MVKRWAHGCLLALLFCLPAVAAPEKAGRVTYHGYDDCIELKNRNTRVILSGACGGRVLEYSLNGVNALLLDPSQAGWTYTPGGPTIDPSAGRMDIGPESTTPPHLGLWLGSWKAIRTGPYSARMTSVADHLTGVRLVRDFVLDPDSSRLTVTQTIRNVSPRTVRQCHWSRTFAPPGGICIVPLDSGGPFPNQVAQWEPGNLINFAPRDQKMVLWGDTLIITGPLKNAKIGLATSVGKLGYLTPNNLLFIKEFPVYPNRVYGEIVAMNLCVCYQQKFCELEPIGPLEEIKPGGSASYTETWTLRQSPFPARGELDYEKLRRLVR